MATDARVIGTTTVHSGRFIESRLITWQDANGVTRKWEAADRAGNIGAVLIIARLRQSDRFIITRQFRPPAATYILEFPAGLIDGDETPEHAARRELREETGYVAETVRVFPPAYTTPGLSNENVNMVLAEIDEEDEANQNPATDFDPSENIVTMLVPRHELHDLYVRETSAGNAFDAKLAAFILAGQNRF